MFLRRVAKCLMVASLLAAAVAWWFKDSLPAPGKLQLDVLDEPVQQAVRKPAFEIKVNGIDYRIQPRFSYDLNGVVTSLHHSDTWWDYAHKEWGDYVNILDICVAWGDSVRSGAYRNADFWSTQWECYYSSRDPNMKPHEMSNNHIVTGDPAVAKAMKKLRIGDQVRIQGYLVDYSIYRDGRLGPPRTTSTVRTDSGNGACEVLYVDGLELLGSANRRWALALQIALGVLVASALAWLALPVRYND